MLLLLGIVASYNSRPSPIGRVSENQIPELTDLESSVIRVLLAVVRPLCLTLIGYGESPRLGIPGLVLQSCTASLELSQKKRESGTSLLLHAPLTSHGLFLALKNYFNQS